MSHSINISCSVSSDGGSPITNRGVVYNTCQFPTIDDNIISVTGTTQPFNATITGVTGGYTYYIRPYATNSSGTSYGQQSKVNVPSPELATVLTISADTITQTGATIYSNITNDGGLSVVRRGVVYSNTENPTYYSNEKVNGSGIGEFSTNIVGLTQTPGSNVYVKSYAINGVGISYSNQIPILIPIYEPTSKITSIFASTDTTSKVSWSITNNGGSSIINSGICWSTGTTTPISGSTNTVPNNASGNQFITSMTGLLNTVTYYVRAYASNSAGTKYSETITYLHDYSPLKQYVYIMYDYLRNDYNQYEGIWGLSFDENGNPISVTSTVNMELVGSFGRKTLIIPNGYNASSVNNISTKKLTISFADVTPSSDSSYNYIYGGYVGDPIIQV